jgi:hypothetical protein
VRPYPWGTSLATKEGLQGGENAPLVFGWDSGARPDTTRRWHALLAENTAIQSENLELTSLFTQPFSPRQKLQLNANAVRRQKLSLKLHDLVDEWTADANAR